MADQVQKGIGNIALDAAGSAKRRSANGPNKDGWQEIQADTFTNWVNAQLTKGGYDTISTLVDDLQDGVALCRMLEVLTDKKLPRYTATPRSKFQKLENLNKAFKFIQDEGLKLVNIGPPDVEAGTLSLILGLVWTIMYHYQILPNLGANTGKSAKDLLLEWVQSKIPEYNITNFNKDWNDGRAICALANAVAGSPPIVPELKTMSPQNGERNAQRGIDEAYEWLAIPKIIDADNMANPNLDDLSMMTYISYFKGAKRRSTRMSDALGASSAKEEPPKQEEAPPVKEETASSSAGKLKPWERSDDWREYKGANLGGRNKIRVYFSTTTSSSIIRKRSEELMRLMERLKLQERPDFEPWIPIDIDMDTETRNKIFEKAGTKETPMLFVDDEFVGTYEKIMEMNESGQLEKIFEY